MYKIPIRLYSRLVILFIATLALSVGIAAVYAENQPKANKPGIGSANKAKPFDKKHPRLRAAIDATQKHGRRMMDMAGVVATATGFDSEGEPVVRIFTDKAGTPGIPADLDGVPVMVEAVGRFYAHADPAPTTKWTRPVPSGISVGHTNITAGTIGARVTDGANIFLLSNNHVLANSNQAVLGDRILQPGPADGGRLSDSIATLHDFVPIIFCATQGGGFTCPQVNNMDAAIGLTSETQLRIATPSNGYGHPNTSIHPAYGNPTTLGDEDLTLLLGETVEKTGRTTGYTSGSIQGIHATVNVCYNATCTLLARFVDQIVITPGNFSAGGDSGSLIVTADRKHPVGLLYAGGDGITIANRIDLVLNQFKVQIDRDTTLPTLSIDDVTVTEGGSGTTTAVFRVSLSRAVSDEVRVDYFSENGSALSGSDYTAASGTLSFQAGALSDSIRITVNTDTDDEATENFFVNLSRPTSNVNLADGQGEALILNRDTRPPAPPILR